MDLGRALAAVFSASIARAEAVSALLLQGDLGSGKTTLVRGLVESLPGAEQAEVSSPSFNICNLYPTTPPAAHFDLYRLEGMEPDEALFDCFDDPAVLTIVEWIQFLSEKNWPEDAVFLHWTPPDTGRNLILHAMGKAADLLETELREKLQHLIQPN